VSDGWHYAEGRKTVGPLTLTEMQRVLSKVSDPHNLLVWKAGFEDWKRAGNVPELAKLSYKPPPLPGQVISPETAAARREWKWHFLQGTLQVLILSGFAVSDVFWQWTPNNNKAFVILPGIGAAWLLTVALPRKLGRDFAIRRIAMPVVVLGLGLLAYKYAMLTTENDKVGLTGKARSAFIESSVNACLKAQNDPANKDIPTWKLTEYCKCYASALVDKVSNNELLSLAKKDQSTWLVAMQPKIDAAADSCLSAIQRP
jgi:GYF domain 2